MDQLQLPIWVLASAFLLNVFKGYLPTLKQYHSDRIGIKACNNRCDELEKKLTKLKIEYEEVNKKYYMLLGSMSIIKTKIKELGFDDITMLNEDNDK
jgi:hypothetical protein